jgi:hypothetical protein
MLLRSQTSTGTSYTATIMFLSVAFVFCPLLLLVSGNAGISLSAAGISAGFAWLSWSRYSTLSVPSIVARRPRTK